MLLFDIWFSLHAKCNFTLEDIVLIGFYREIFCRSSASRVFPAMYIEGVTELAFADVGPNDSDFAYIQGDVTHIHVSSHFSLDKKSI